MDEKDYHDKWGWKIDPFVKSSSLDIPIVKQSKTYTDVIKSLDAFSRVLVMEAPIGFGKTTFINFLRSHKPKSIDYIESFDAESDESLIMKRIKDNLPFHKKLFKGDFDRSNFGEYLGKCLGSKKILLIFDEAQDYESDMFKWFRTVNDKATNCFMLFSGITGINNTISKDSAFRDRKTNEIELVVLNADELKELIRRRILWAGGKDIRPFTEEGLNSMVSMRKSYPPRKLLDDCTSVIEECAKRDILKIGKVEVSNVFGKVSKKKTKEKEPATLFPYKITDFPKSQQRVIEGLMDIEKITIPELSKTLDMGQSPLTTLIKRLQGLDGEAERRKNVRYPIVEQIEESSGRSRYMYSLSDDARRVLARK